MIKTLVLTLFLFPALIFAQVNLKPANLLEGKITILIPENFRKIGEEEFRQKFGEDVIPAMAVSDGKDVNIRAYENENNVKVTQLGRYVEVSKKALQKEKPDVNFLESGVRDVGPVKVGFYKMTYQAIVSKSTAVFAYHFLISVDDKSQLFIFTCKAEDRADWEPLVDRMINSLKRN